MGNTHRSSLTIGSTKTKLYFFGFSRKIRFHFFFWIQHRYWYRSTTSVVFKTFFQLFLKDLKRNSFIYKTYILMAYQIFNHKRSMWKQTEDCTNERSCKRDHKGNVDLDIDLNRQKVFCSGAFDVQYWITVSRIMTGFLFRSVRELKRSNVTSHIPIICDLCGLFWIPYLIGIKI